LVITKKRSLSVRKLARIIMGIGIALALGFIASLSKVVGQYLSTKWLLYISMVVGMGYLLLEIYKRYLIRR
jgi:uncharacterized BrkB/YihY/UPF0761 family membrane protein